MERKVPHAKNGYRFIAKEKSLGILHFDVFFPLPMHAIVLKHVNLNKMEAMKISIYYPMLYAEINSKNDDNLLASTK